MGKVFACLLSYTVADINVIAMVNHQMVAKSAQITNVKNCEKKEYSFTGTIVQRIL